jgi:arginine:ornithine antiporter/lysine permease
MIGEPGALIMITGLIVSATFAWLSWLIISAEVPFSAAGAGGVFPRRFGTANKKGAPVFSLFITTIATQCALILAFCSENAWNMMMSITGVMVMPVYFMTAVYLGKISSKKLFPEGFGVSRRRAFITAALGTAYAVWLIYAAGVKYLLLATIFFAIGIPFYLCAQRQRRKMLSKSPQD